MIGAVPKWCTSIIYGFAPEIASKTLVSETYAQSLRRKNDGFASPRNVQGHVATHEPTASKTGLAIQLSFAHGHVCANCYCLVRCCKQETATYSLPMSDVVKQNGRQVGHCAGMRLRQCCPTTTSVAATARPRILAQPAFTPGCQTRFETTKSGSYPPKQEFLSPKYVSSRTTKSALME